MSRAWDLFLHHHWDALERGQKVTAPSWIGHPLYAGFRMLPAAEKHGQVADWGVSMPDGSRVHVHEMSDGSLVAHRDRHDPQRGVVSALRHVVTETRVGRAAAVGGAVYGLSRLVGVFL